MPLTQKNIGILTLIAMFIIAIYGYSANLELTGLNPPSEINYNSDSSFYFSLHNYGEKAGSYFIQISSDVLFVKIGNSEYNDQSYISKYVEDGEDSAYRFYLKANQSNLPINATVKLTYLDKSPLILKKKYVWDYYYKHDDSLKYGTYILNRVQNKIQYCIMINDQDGICSNVNL